MARASVLLVLFFKEHVLGVLAVSVCVTAPSSRSDPATLHRCAGKHPVGACDASRQIADIFPRMERAHSWLRTIAIANWTGSSILAPHVQGLMELISALKVVLQLVAADSVAAPVVAAGRHDGREGPVLCSLVSLARRTVVESMSVSQGTLAYCRPPRFVPKDGVP